MDPISDSIGCLSSRKLSRELKRRARAALISRYTVPMTAFAVSQMVVMFVNLPFESAFQKNPSVFQFVISGLAAVIISLLSNVLTGGLIYIHLNLTDGKSSNLTDVFRYFNRNPERFILSALLFTAISAIPMLPAAAITAIAVSNGAALMYAITVFAWAVTLIPLLFISFAYALTNYLLVEEPQAGIKDLFKKSRRLMYGYKRKLFYLNLSFIGMYLLGILSFGIGFLWVMPYRNQTFAEFYRTIQNNL